MPSNTALPRTSHCALSLQKVEGSRGESCRLEKHLHGRRIIVGKYECVKCPLERLRQETREVCTVNSGISDFCKEEALLHRKKTFVFSLSSGWQASWAGFSFST